jgi:hypothetical protein
LRSLPAGLIDGAVERERLALRVERLDAIAEKAFSTDLTSLKDRVAALERKKGA